jgi:hypothetical protein
MSLWTANVRLTVGRPITTEDIRGLAEVLRPHGGSMAVLPGAGDLEIEITVGTTAPPPHAVASAAEAATELVVDLVEAAGLEDVDVRGLEVMTIEEHDRLSMEPREPGWLEDKVDELHAIRAVATAAGDTVPWRRWAASEDRGVPEALSGWEPQGDGMRPAARRSGPDASPGHGRS